MDTNLLNFTTSCFCIYEQYTKKSSSKDEVSTRQILNPLPKISNPSEYLKNPPVLCEQKLQFKLSPPGIDQFRIPWLLNLEFNFVWSLLHESDINNIT